MFECLSKIIMAQTLFLRKRIYLLVALDTFEPQQIVLTYGLQDLDNSMLQNLILSQPGLEVKSSRRRMRPLGRQVLQSLVQALKLL